MSGVEALQQKYDKPADNFTSRSYQGLRAATLASVLSLKGLNEIKDPMSKYAMYIDIMKIGMVFGLNYTMETMDDDLDRLRETIEDLRYDIDNTENLPPNTLRNMKKHLITLQRDEKNLQTSRENMDQISKEANVYMKGFSDWVKQPMYSPDHPYGSQIMTEAAHEFHLSEKLKEEK